MKLALASAKIITIGGMVASTRESADFFLESTPTLFKVTSGVNVFRSPYVPAMAKADPETTRVV